MELEETKFVYLKKSSNDEVCFWHSPKMSNEEICLHHEKKGIKRSNLIFENMVDVDFIISLGYKCYKLKDGNYVPYSYNTLYSASNFNVMAKDGLSIYFFKTENFKEETPIIIGLKIKGRGVSYIQMPCDFKELYYKSMENVPILKQIGL